MPVKPFYIILALILILLGISAYWLTLLPSMPAVQKMQRTMPDDHIPR